MISKETSFRKNFLSFEKHTKFMDLRDWLLLEPVRIHYTRVS